MVSFPMEFGSVDNGERISLLCEMVLADPKHDAHLMKTHNGISFYLEGLVEAGFHRYAILDAILVAKFPFPSVSMQQDSRLLTHSVPSWSGLRKIVDSCSGFGGIAHGAQAMGFETMVAVDTNPLMLSLHAMHSGAEVVAGDIGSNETIFQVWQRAEGAAVITGGFSCQPFSRLGDQRGSEDPRSMSLPGILKAAFYLHSQAVLLECVQPAHGNAFVNSQIDHFCSVLGFHKTVVDLRLDMVWPCKRFRTWWLLTSPIIGAVNLQEWPELSSMADVGRVIPYISKWDPRDELALALDETELAAFGAHDGSYVRYMLCSTGKAPCALHAWGSQLRGCPCGCRSQGFSEHRLASKGLFGLLVWGFDKEGNPMLRHVHPNECMALNGMDPMIDMGLQVRLVLGAVGQIASPLQVVWVLSFLSQKLDEIRYGSCKFGPLSQLHAFRSWLCMRCSMVWPTIKEVQDDISPLVKFWLEYKDFSIGHLMNPENWSDLVDRELSIAAVLDCIIRHVQSDVLPKPVPFEVDDETPWIDEPPVFEPHIPVLVPHGDRCLIAFTDDIQAPVCLVCEPRSTVQQCLSAQAKLVGQFRVSRVTDPHGGEVPLCHVLSAGQSVIVHVCTQSGFVVSVGPDVVGRPTEPQVVCCPGVDFAPPCGVPCHNVADDLAGNDSLAHVPFVPPPVSDVKCLVPEVPCRPGECGPLPKMPTDASVECNEDAFRAFVPGKTSKANTSHANAGECGPLPRMPTVEGSYPCQNRDVLNAQHVGSVVAGECGPLPKLPMPSDQGPLAKRTQATVLDATVSPTADWSFPCVGEFPGQKGGIECGFPSSVDSLSSAAALFNLANDQFLNLGVPAIGSVSRFDAIVQQAFSGPERTQLLECQGFVMADDEIYFHLQSMAAQANQSAEGQPKHAPVVVIDPLLSAAWTANVGFSVDEWAAAHKGIYSQGSVVIGIFRHDNHWIPIELVPNGRNAVVHTWDDPKRSHEHLNQLLQNLGRALGFAEVMVHRHQRMFFTSTKCGALALSFIHHALFHTQLPGSDDEAAFVHCRLRERFVKHLSSCRVARRPWVWGNGDETPPNAPDAQSSGDLAQGDRPMQSSHQCITRDERIDLLTSHGKAMGDDEIRFHLQTLIKKRMEQADRGLMPFRTFLFFEPLNFCNWDEVGHILTERWCQNLPFLGHDGLNILSAMLCDSHWIPLWIVPAGRVMVVHTFNDEVDFDIVDGKLRWLGLHLGCHDVVVHRIPNGLPDHRMCGAHAMAFIAHITMNADLPLTLDELADFHANMRASFVQALFEEDFCRCPVFWGEGGNGALIKSLAAELEKRGVPPAMVEQRAAQAIRVLGSEPVIQALQHRLSWKQLKTLANNASFKFVLPSELEKNIADNKGKPVGRKIASEKPAPAVPEIATLDVDKLQVLEGVFRAEGQVMQQLHQQQIGPVSSGFVLISSLDAEPYLKASKQVSKEPLALVVFCRPDVDIHTMLPHRRVTVPCRCKVNNEPILAEAILVQIGGTHVEKFAGSQLVNIGSPEVVTLKINVFRDEFADQWEVFCRSPIRSIVHLIPELKRCHEDGCNLPVLA